MILQRIRPGKLEVAELTVVSDVAVLGLHVARHVSPLQQLTTLGTCVGAPLVRHLSIYCQVLCWKFQLGTQHFRSTIKACILMANFFLLNTPYLFQVFLWDIRPLSCSHLLSCLQVLFYF